MKKPLKAALLAFSLMHGIGSFALLPAATVSWKASPLDDNWLNPLNWNGDALPTSADTARVGYGTINITTNLPEVNRLEMGSNTGVMNEIIIHEGGVLNIKGSGLTRLGDKSGGRKGTITVDGGLLNSVGRVYLGVDLANVEAVLTVKNGGSVNGASLGMGHTNHTNQTAVLNIGGEGAAEAPGWLNLISGPYNGYIEASAGTTGGGANQNTINFNHTSSRYLFSRSETDATAILITKSVKVDVKAGVTVLTGSNTYTEGTTIRNGAVLLANTQTETAGISSVGVGPVTVEAGGTLGGTGTVGGTTLIEGILKPGDYDYGATVPTHGVLQFLDDVAFTEQSLTLIAIQGLERGIGYDAIDVAGDVILDGTLRIVLQLGFTLAAGETETFNVLNVTGDLSGDYASFELPDEWNGVDLVWDTSLFSSTGALSVTAIPEPSTALSLGLGLGALAFMARRRSSRAVNA